jgi:leader peptidase (prepilin peptidase)/N-methyltransferase
MSAAARALIAFPFGLIFGSFMTVVVTRVPAKESLLRPRSRCPACGAQVRNRDNIPVLSWLLLRGRCRDCGERIPAMYPLLELATGLLVAAGAARFDDLAIILIVCPLLAMLPGIALIDLRHKIIPNRLMYPSLIGFPVAIVIATLLGAPFDLVGMVVGFLAYGGGLLLVALVSGGMGMGDVKLAAVIGLVLGALGLEYVAVAAAAAIVIGGVAGVAALAMGRGRKSAIPFGPAIAAGAVVAVFFGQAIADWYAGRLS